MAFTGWFSLGGNEIVNAARAEAYVDGALPTFGLRRCVDTSGLASALGETYGSPIIDSAPWYDRSNPITGEFYGVYPLDVQGIEDSVREVAQQEALGNGTVFSKPRETGRDIRFNVLLLGSCEAALDAGQQWLNRALEGSCGAVSGCDLDDLCFLSEAPPLADWSNCPSVPLDTVGEEPNYNPTFPDSISGLWWPSGDVSFFGSRDGSFSVEVDSLGGYVYRLVEGLVPGATYRVEVDGLRTGDFSVLLEVAGAGTFYMDHDTSDSTVPSPYLYDFVAPATSVMMKLQPVLRDGTTPTTTNGYSMTFGRIVMKRVSAGAQVYHSEFRNDGTPSTGWSMNTTDFYLDNSSLQAYWDTPRVGTTVGTISRSLRGMVIGRTYRVNLLYNLYVDDDSDLDLSASMSGWAGTTQREVVSGVDYYLVYEFVAQDTIGTLTFTFASTDSTGTSEGVSLNVLDVRDVTDQTDILRAQSALPSGAEGLQRSMYEVVATQGAVLAEDYKKECGAMRRVTFALRAGKPDVFGPQRDVGTLLGGTSLIVPDYTTCADGVEQRVNYMANPSIEVDAGGFTASGSGWAVSRQANSTTIAPKFGAAKLALTKTAGTASQGVVTYSQNAEADFPLIPGGTYTLSMYLSTNIGGTNERITMPLEVTITDGTDENTFVKSIDLSGGTSSPRPWIRQSITFDNPFAGNVTNWKFKISTPTYNVARSLFIDGIMLESGSTPGNYFDGTINGGEWTGTVGKSISTLTPAPFDPTIDPNCVQPPLPPQPPSIDDSCIVNPGTWRRYILPIPRDDIPGYGAAVPLLTVTTGNVPVRQARVRFHANPLDLDFSYLDACGFCGEIQVSYIPTNAVFQIDGVRRNATVTTDASGEVSASHLLYGTSNGGPVDWPELSCGIDYYAVVDLDSSADTSQVDVSLSLGVMV